MKKRIVILIIYLCFFTFVNKSHAAQSPVMSVSPVVFNLSLSPGKTHTYELTVQNLLSVPLPLKAELGDFESEDELGGVRILNTQVSPLLSWLHIDKPEMILEPHEKKVIPITLNLPKTIPVGGYSGMLFLQPVLPSQKASTLVNARVGILIIANVGIPPSQGKKAEIVNFTFDKLLYETGPVQTRIRVKNISISNLLATPHLTFQSLFGKPTKIDLEDKFIFPGKVRKWERSVELPSYKAGIYRATLSVSLGNGEQISESTYLIAFPAFYGVICLVILIIAIFLIKRKSRISKALKALIVSE